MKYERVKKSVRVKHASQQKKNNKNTCVVLGVMGVT